MRKSPYREPGEILIPGEPVIPKTFRERLVDALLGGARLASVLGALAIVGGVSFVGWMVGACIALKPPAPCVDVVDIRGPSDSPFACPAGSHLIVRDRKFDSHVEVRCVCSASEAVAQHLINALEKSDGGTP